MTSGRSLKARSPVAPGSAHLTRLHKGGKDNIVTRWPPSSTRADSVGGTQAEIPAVIETFEYRVKNWKENAHRAHQGEGNEQFHGRVLSWLEIIKGPGPVKGETISGLSRDPRPPFRVDLFLSIRNGPQYWTMFGKDFC